MSISHFPALRHIEFPETNKGIFDEALAERLRAARESEEALIRDSAKNVLEAEALLLEALEEMDRSPSQLAKSAPLTAEYPLRLILKPMADSSSEPPDHEEEMAEWDELYDEIRERLTRLLILH